MSANADTKTNTLWGGNGAPEVVDLRLLEDGGERGGALHSDVSTETAGEGRNEDGKRAAVTRGAVTQKQTFEL